MSSGRISKYVSILYRYNQAAMAKLLEHMGIGIGQYPYIMAVCEEPGITQDKLTSRLFYNKSSVARAIAQLEAGGYLQRITDSADKRVYRLYPTEKGRESLPTIRSYLDKMSGEFTAGFTPEEEAEAVRLLRRMADNMTAQKRDVMSLDRTSGGMVRSERESTDE